MLSGGNAIKESKNKTDDVDSEHCERFSIEFYGQQQFESVRDSAKSGEEG